MTIGIGGAAAAPNDPSNARPDAAAAPARGFARFARASLDRFCLNACIVATPPGIIGDGGPGL
jgi:hypothetical protein